MNDETALGELRLLTFCQWLYFNWLIEGGKVLADIIDEEQEVEIIPSSPSLPLATLLYTPSMTGDVPVVSPVSAAIARHMGINLTPDGIAARNRRGIAIIVHGAPLSGMYCREPYNYHCSHCALFVCAVSLCVYL